jgi:hypothetical protein
LERAKFEKAEKLAIAKEERALRLSELKSSALAEKENKKKKKAEEKEKEKK